MSEKIHVQNKIIELAEADGWFVRLLSWRGRRGAQDLFLLKNGRIVLGEVKDRGKLATGEAALQERNRKEMQAQGAECYVWDSVFAASEVLGLGVKYDPLRPRF